MFRPSLLSLLSFAAAFQKEGEDKKDKKKVGASSGSMLVLEREALDRIHRNEELWKLVESNVFQKD